MSPVSGPGKLVAAARAGGITDRRALEAIRRTPRAAFVPGACAGRAYDDAPIPMPHGQVTTQPSLPAAMIAAPGLAGAEKVLEAGTGSGHQTALPARLAARVVSIGIGPDLAARARRNLAAQGIGNVVVLAGDGTEGAPDFPPFDAIVISAACPRVPSPLPAQLRTGGRLVQPIGPGAAEYVVLHEKERDGLRRVRTLTEASFVRLHGRYWLSDHFGARPFATGGMVVPAGSFWLLEILPVSFAYWQFALILLLNGIGMGLFASPNRAAIMNSLPPERRGAGSGMAATFQNSSMVLSIGIFSP